MNIDIIASYLPSSSPPLATLLPIVGTVACIAYICFTAYQTPEHLRNDTWEWSLIASSLLLISPVFALIVQVFLIIFYNPYTSLAGIPISEEDLPPGTPEQFSLLKQWIGRLNELQNRPDIQFDLQRIFETVASIIKRARSDKVYGGIFWAVLKDASTTCGDRFILSIIDLEIQERLLSQTAQKPTNLGELSYIIVRGEMTKDLLATCAAQVIAANRSAHNPEEIEIYLGYLIYFKDKFKMPFTIDNMLYPGFLYGIDMAAAENFVRSHITNEEAVLSHLAKDDKWQEALKTVAGPNLYKLEEDLQRINQQLESENPDYKAIQAERENCWKQATKRALGDKLPELLNLS